ncbi:MAG: hypothetical protein P8129_21135 [Anaerolineae bacterium]
MAYWIYLGPASKTASLVKAPGMAGSRNVKPERGSGDRFLAPTWFKAAFVAEWTAFDVPLLDIAALAAMVVPVLLLSILGYRYYVKTKLGSVWADAAFVGQLAGLASWVCGVALRGYVLDYLQLPGVVTADLKDILLSVGAAAFVVEALDSPHVSWQWEGWRAEREKLRDLVTGFVRFSAQELRGVRQTLTAAAKSQRREQT